VDALLREPVLRRRRLEVTAESLRRGSWASAALAGSDVPLSLFSPPFGVDESGSIAAAALRTTAQVGSLSAVWSRAPLQALARLHTLVAADHVTSTELGRPRDDREVSLRLGQLAEVVTSPTEAAGLVVGAVVHGEILALQPFVWGNGLVARAALRLVLVGRGVDPDALSIPEEGMLELGEASSREALAGYVSGEAAGVTRWLVHVASSVARGAAAGRRVCQGLPT
jgi:hypothetical protein